MKEMQNTENELYPSERAIKKSVIISTVFVIFDIFLLSSIFFIDINYPNALAFLDQVINHGLLGKEIGTEDILPIIRLIFLAGLIILSIVDLVYTLYSILTKKSFTIDYEKPIEGGFAKVLFTQNLFSYGRAICWALYITFTEMAPRLLESGSFLEKYKNVLIYLVIIILIKRITALISRPFLIKVKDYTRMLFDEQNKKLDQEIAEIKEESKKRSKEERGIDTDEEEEAKEYESQIENFDILIKYKQLYDSGAITQEEYEKKREELLNKTE